MNSVENFNKDDYSLFPIHIKEWEGFIFINLSDDPEDFDKTFSPIKGRFSNWNISDLKTLETKEYEVKGFPSVLVEVDGQRKEGPREYSKMIDMINSVTGGNIQA